MKQRSIITGTFMIKQRIFQNQFHLISLGCPRNLVDSEVMIGILIKAGYECTLHLKDADFIVINTCSFLEASRQEALAIISEIFRTKKKNAKVIIAGCMVQKCKEELKAQFPEIHYFVGSGDVEKILEAMQTALPGEAVTNVKSYLECGDVPRTLSTPSHYAYLKIAEGCQKQCSYCIIPSIKGHLRSKFPEQIVKEFRDLLDRGVFEIILVAQDLGDFGKDRKEKGALASLLQKLLQDPRPFWLRLLYLYPDEIDETLIQIMKSDPRICPYLDMPIQHINDSILRAMRRKTNRSQITQTIELLRHHVPPISIRTSLIVGFPGETQEQFQELVDFIQKEQFDQVGFFPFSAERGAIASLLDGQIPEEEKNRRVQIIAEKQQKVVSQKLKRFIGQKLTAIIDGFHPDSNLLLSARHHGQCPEIDGQIIINDAPNRVMSGQLYSVEITDVSGYDLIGRVIKKVRQ